MLLGVVHSATPCAAIASRAQSSTHQVYYTASSFAAASSTAKPSSMPGAAAALASFCAPGLNRAKVSCTSVLRIATSLLPFPVLMNSIPPMMAQPTPRMADANGAFRVLMPCCWALGEPTTTTGGVEHDRQRVNLIASNQKAHDIM